jgi:hypothetical protein
MGQNVAGDMAEVLRPFIGPERRPVRRRESGQWRWSFTLPVTKSKRGEGSRRDTELMGGKRS